MTPGIFQQVILGQHQDPPEPTAGRGQAYACVAISCMLFTELHVLDG